MITSTLPNARWILLPSDSLGEDWLEKSQEIDDILAPSGWELAEETVYLIYDSSPQDVLKSHGHCLIGRPVTGPKKTPPSPFQLQDWTAQTAEVKRLSHRNWEELLAEVMTLADLRPKKTTSFMLRLRRRLRPELDLEADIIFTE